MQKLNEAIEAIKLRQFIIGTVDQYGYFSISNSPVFHGNETSVQAELKRLATQNPGKVYVSMQLRKGMLVPPVVQIMDF